MEEISNDNNNNNNNNNNNKAIKQIYDMHCF